MMTIEHSTNGNFFQNLSGTRLVVAAFGILCGLTGIIAGCFEIRQGNIAPSGFVISTIGSDYRMADDFTYFAVTIIPNLFLTGILVVIVSSLVIVWSVGFVHKKKGVVILLGLSITQMLVGGGWMIDLALITCLLATQIDQPLRWWRAHLPSQLRLWFVKLFPLSLVVYVIIAFTMLVLTLLGVNDVSVIQLLEPLAIAMFLPILLLVFGGLSRDIQRQGAVPPS